MLFAALLATLTLQPMQEIETPSPKLPRWEHVGGDDKGDFAIDPQTMHWEGRRVRVFVRLILQRDGGGDPTIGVMRYVYDCKAHTALVEQIDIFDTDGQLLHSNPSAPEDMQDEPITADTPNDAVTKRVCR